MRPRSWPTWRRWRCRSGRLARPRAAVSPAGEVRASPIAKRLAREHGIDLAQVPGTGEGGRITEKDVQTAIDARTVPPAAAQERSLVERVSPLARRLARDHGIDLSQVQGSGGGGRITEKDVQAAIEARKAPVPSPAPTIPTVTTFPTTAPMAGMRQAIARRMHESLQSMAQLTLHTEADVTELVALRQQMKADSPVTYTDFIVSACARALRQQRGINVTLVGDTIHYLPDIHIGLAVALDNGLVVPVIRHADRKALAELAQERARLAERQRAGQLTGEEMSGGTFTVTNLGGYGVDRFTPIINLPEAAILGVGRIAEKIVVYQGRIAQRWMVGLSLTVDHRLIDGSPGAAFLQAIQAYLQAPGQLT